MNLAFELNNAIINMGYRYMGKKDNLYVWAKPIGRAILIILIEPNLQKITIKSVYKYLKQVHNYDSNKTEYEDFKDWKYDDFIDFIAHSETWLHIDSAMASGDFVGSFAFKSLKDPYEDLLIEYD